MMELQQSDKKNLLIIARKAIAESLGILYEVPFDNLRASLKQELGSFVTIHSKGSLRGCIGNMKGAGPLHETVRKMACSAAFEDPRFPAVSKSEYNSIDLEISVLYPMELIDSPEDFEAGVHGLYIRQGLQSGVLLPQVATQQAWDKQTFLSHTCMKAGLPMTCWKSSDCDIYRFKADVFGENDFDI